MTVRNITDTHLVCRTVGHSWDDNPAGEIKTIFSWYIALRCTRCTTERFDFLNNAGEVMRRQYRYADGYRRSRDDKSPTRLQVRVELMRRRIFARRVGK